MRKLLFFILISLVFKITYSQTPAGNCFHVINYDSWLSSSQPPIYVDCGKNSILNTGYEITIEVWANLDFTQPSKIVNKIASDGGVFDNGYVLGIGDGNIYSEIWNPNNNVIKTGNIPGKNMWVHLATTFMAGDTMKSYINGVLVGSLQVPANQIGYSDSSLIIGAMAWGSHNGYNIYGNIDEIRIWSYAKSKEQINQDMFRQMKGNEQNLVGYWNCNETSGGTMHDITSFQSHGVIYPAVADTFWAWHPSFAVLGDEHMYGQHDITGIWYGKDQTVNPFSLTTTGLNLVTDIGNEAWDYTVYGNNADTGTTVNDLAPGAPANFIRAKKIWYVNVGGNASADMIFNLANTAEGGTQLLSNQPTVNYTLLVRNDTTGDFVPMASADYKVGVGIKFSGINLQDKYFTIGVGDSPWAGISEISNPFNNIGIFPNPVNSILSIDNITVKELKICVYDIFGQRIFEKQTESDKLNIDMSGYASGTYVVQLMNKNNVLTKKIILQKK